jgi:hypothetical protein
MTESDAYFPSFPKLLPSAGVWERGMKRVFVALLLSLMLALDTSGQEVSSRQPTVDSMEPDFLDFWFSNVQVDHGILVMKRSSEDLSFMFQKGTGIAVASPPSGVLRLPVGMPGRLINHQSELKFIPFPDRSGRNLFLLEETNRVGDTHVGLLCLTAKAMEPRTIKVLPVPANSREGLASLEAQVKTGTFTDSAK